MLCHAFECLGLEGEIDTLIRSIPYSQRHDKKLVKSLKAEKHFSWRSTGVQKSLEVNNVVVFPQGVGALRAWQNGVYGDPFQPSSLVSIEIGSQTTDAECIILAGGGAQFITESEWPDKRIQRLDEWADCIGQLIDIDGDSYAW